ncbi:MAG: inner membrane protein YhaI [Actinomycetota bacterium]|jgi:uncharacterized membrane protein YhaH (DUF805 family)
MSFGAAIQSFFKNYANFKGRARRSEYWYAVLFVLLVSLALEIVFPSTVMMTETGIPVSTPSIVSTIWLLAVLIPGLAVVWRRLHDVDKGGPYYFIGLIPVVGAILLLIQFAKDGTPGANRFGDPVK